MIFVVVPADGAFTWREYLVLDLPEVATWLRVLTYEELPTMREFPRGTYVWAGIDQLSPGMLDLVSVVHSQLQAAGGVRFLNHPTETLRRFDLLDRLYRSGKNTFRAVRVGADLARLSYPVFLRGERSHDGNLSSLLHSPREVEQAIGKAAIQGHDLGDLMLIEFCRVADEDGFYRKYAAFKVGGRIMARSLQHGLHWMVKFADAEYTQSLVNEERAYMLENPHAEVLDEFFRIANVDYGQIDYSFQGGRMLVWEINLNPTLGRGKGPGGGIGPVELHPIRDEAREFFFDRFREAWRELDSGPADAPPVRVEFDRELIRRTCPAPTLASRMLATARAVVRPVKPVVEPLAGPVIRWLGKTAVAARRPQP